MTQPQDPKTLLERLMATFAFVAPVLVLPGILYILLSEGFSLRTGMYGLVLFVFTSHVGRYLFLRGRRQRAQMISATIDPSDSEPTRTFTDVAVLVVALSMVGISIWVPLSGAWLR